MDSAATQRLINKILSYWEMEPSTLRCRAWEHALTDLDEGRAGTVFAQATRKHDTINPAKFVQMYADIKPDTNHQAECPRCEGTARTTNPIYTPCPNCAGTGRADRPSGPAMPLSQHLTKLRRACELGSKAATQELADWRNRAQGQNPWLTLNNPAILKALDD
ncbi:hypothetical protein UFOVP1266_20 [uncultured Caudovirales phage]|uniref:Uncharacterized protein n=1 Tax=uncultured Caudovirales phage TaxID=2100421 RepID=A0A6J5PEV8_9CAUD|nr:hypothetical protein UFOVP876_20 [uncultured Caudovirales phage]CAB4195031.1 hypothetical protein UFOVP1266_20 [uncultured Caudovirales phage]